MITWAEFAVRWLHVITAIAWIGSSLFYCARFRERKARIYRKKHMVSNGRYRNWVLPYPKIFGRPGQFAGTFDLV